MVVERITHRKLYRLPDAIANLSCGITQQLSGLFLRVFDIGVYELLYTNVRFLSLAGYSNTWWYWLLLFLLVDLAYYWAHRMSHEINLFWGGHVVHHQSEEYNLSVALRQSSFQVIWTFAFSLPIALLGFDTMHFALISAFNTLYQFWIHTETINRMGWFEYIFNTPSHHRVHHGRNPQYIDKNHAGTLIIWDKMFGTFEEEKERPVYGITTPINSWNAVWANFSHYAHMAEDLKQIKGWGDKIRYLFNKPGWMPAYLGGYKAPPTVDPATYHKYDTPAVGSLNYYVLFQYTLCLVGTALFLFKSGEFNLWQKGLVATLISWYVVNAGVLFERRVWVNASEWIRIFFFGLLGAWYVSYLSLAPVWYAGCAAYVLVSALWFFKVVRDEKS